MNEENAQQNEAKPTQQKKKRKLTPLTAVLIVFVGAPLAMMIVILAIAGIIEAFKSDPVAEVAVETSKTPEQIEMDAKSEQEKREALHIKFVAYSYDLDKHINKIRGYLQTLENLSSKKLSAKTFRNRSNEALRDLAVESRKSYDFAISVWEKFQGELKDEFEITSEKKIFWPISEVYQWIYRYFFNMKLTVEKWEAVIKAIDNMEPQYDTQALQRLVEDAIKSHKYREEEFDKYAKQHNSVLDLLRTPGTLNIKVQTAIPAKEMQKIRRAWEKSVVDTSGCKFKSLNGNIIEAELTKAWDQAGYVSNAGFYIATCLERLQKNKLLDGKDIRFVFITKIDDNDRYGNTKKVVLPLFEIAYSGDELDKVNWGKIEKERLFDLANVAQSRSRTGYDMLLDYSNDYGKKERTPNLCRLILDTNSF
jgi:hypothetical protein